jgi:5-methylcytosine-specific restriction endonuclease McrBC regulatory subunit McrC
MQDERRMRRVFERFVLRFAKHHAPTGHKVPPLTLDWAGTKQHLVPNLRMDVAIERRGHSRVVECKYTAAMLSEGPHGSQTFQPQHLRQLFAYLSRVQAQHGARQPVDGILLYPAIDKSESYAIELGGFGAQVVRVSLSQPWGELATELRFVLFGGAP